MSAAALCSDGFNADQAIAPLEQARKGASTEQRTIIDQALVRAYASTDNDSKRIAAAERLFAAEPKSKVARLQLHIALGEAGRLKQLKANIQKLLKESPDDDYLKRALIRAETQLGRLQEAQRLQKQSIDSGSANGTTYNSFAWRSLFIGNAGEEEIGYALRAVQLSNGGLSALHTLGCAYADAGRVYDARQTFVKLLQSRPQQQPHSVDHYIHGRIAEHLELPAEAKAAYGRVEKGSSDTDRTTTYNLAQRQLKKLR